jgi:hypothetical protein
MLLGGFDGMHVGHRTLLAKAKGYGLPVGAMTIVGGKKTQSLFTLEEREHMFKDLGLDFAVCFSFEEIKELWRNYKGRPQELGLPSAPEQFITYFEEDNRPQAKLDRDLYGGMGVSVGRLREDTLFDYKFVGLSHNTLRGAAGGAVLIAELLYREGYIVKK